MEGLPLDGSIDNLLLQSIVTRKKVYYVAMTIIRFLPLGYYLTLTILNLIVVKTIN